MICKNSLMDTQICKCHECYSPPGGKALASVSGCAAPVAKPRLQQAVEDFIWNVEHAYVAGYGDIEAVCDASFREMKEALRAEAQHNDKLTDAGE
jgi:hypothetical protein